MSKLSHIFCLGEPLFVFFGLLALLFFKKIRHKHAFVVVFCSSAHSWKETGIVFIPIILVITYFCPQTMASTIGALSYVSPCIHVSFHEVRRCKVHMNDSRCADDDCAFIDRYLQCLHFWFYIKPSFPNNLFILQLWSVQRQVRILHNVHIVSFISRNSLRSRYLDLAFKQTKPICISLLCNLVLVGVGAHYKSFLLILP